MPTQIRVPQMGEGLREVLIRELLKQPGDTIQRDEKLYAVETDKAALEIESPVTGVLESWSVEPNQVVAVGSVVAEVREVEADSPAPAQPQQPNGHDAADPSPVCKPPGAVPRIPPRTRAFCRERGVTNEQLSMIPVNGKTLMPEDVARWLDAGDVPTPEPTSWTDKPVSDAQRVLNYRMARSAQLVAPATIRAVVQWSRLEAVVRAFRTAHPRVAISEFDVIAYQCAQATTGHPLFRSLLSAADTLREYAHVNLGLAVAGMDDDLRSACIRQADTLAFTDFVKSLHEHVESAINGADQAVDDTQLFVTYVSDLGIVDAVPLLFAPAVAAISLGSPVDFGAGKTAFVSLTFDHRVINGMAAARFLQTICDRLQTVPELTVDTDTVVPSDAESVPVEDAERLELVMSSVREHVGDLLGLEPDAVDDDVPLINQGLSSQLSVELTQRLGDTLQCKLPQTLVWNHPSIAAIAPALLDVYDSQQAAPLSDDRAASS